MSCPDLGLPNNGTIECAFGDDGVASYQDMCRFSCVEGYRLSGSASLACQGNGTWNGSSATCHRGKLHLVMHSPNVLSHPVPIYHFKMHVQVHIHKCTRKITQYAVHVQHSQKCTKTKEHANVHEHTQNQSSVPVCTLG